MGLFETFVDPPRRYTLIPFWFLNDALADEELRRQIDDFEAHGVYGFIPHARMGLPTSIPYMSEAWLHFITVCVDHAAAKDMTVVLYDEGMYPSGSCCGQVVKENPRYATRCLDRRKKGEHEEGWEVVAEDAQWTYVNRLSNGHIRGVHFGQDDGEPLAPQSADLLSPEAMACFRRLVLDRPYEGLKEHFGTTIIAVFTDEPDVLGRGHLGDVKPWTWGFESHLESCLGYDFRPHLAALWDNDHPDADRHRANFARAVDARLQAVYYAPYSQWCADHGVALTGHPAGPDDIGTERHFHIPGQDIVWRYIEPYQDKSIEGNQSTMAKCSVSAQRHYGRERNANECFGAYGWEFTYEEMKYIVNWLFVRGVNMLYPHAFYYSLRGPRRDERPPDVGPGNTWWANYKVFADYCRRMSWLLAQGTHVCEIAILGTTTDLPWRAARVLFETQRDFNYLDTDTLAKACTISAEGVAVHDMRYRAVIVDGAQYATGEALALLKPIIEAGRVIAYGEAIDGVPKTATEGEALIAALDGLVAPDVVVTPPCKGLRYTHMRTAEADIYVFANEQPEPIEGTLSVAAEGARQWWDPETAAVLDGVPSGALELPKLATRVLCVRREA
ncbi:MAG TPA: glycosyl hydrolase [Candidatus Hydrogenedentes bacterium]|nr:glycosyl hydrolase [Candidatus Hydrogenedentota bacterium]HPG65562.1 glycosyl hydrolase [Candidatus Hydrogenedentota bacterium]